MTHETELYERRIAKLESEVARLRNAVTLAVKHMSPRAHRLGCECDGTYRDGVTCRQITAALCSAIVRDGE